MTPRILYIIGQPGSGKSTLVRETFGRLAPRIKIQSEPFPHELWFHRSGSAANDPTISLGRMRANGFDGTDAMSMSVQPRVTEWLRGQLELPYGYRRILAEGDRLANDKFFRAVIDQGWHLDILYLDASDELAAARRAMRGSKQNATWLKGRITKSRRLAERWHDHVLTYPASDPLQTKVDDLTMHPFFRED